MQSHKREHTKSTVGNDAFRQALQLHTEMLSEREKRLFAGGTAEDALALFKCCDDDHALRSKSRKFAGEICRVVKGLEDYFGIIETTVSARPEIAALVWGGVKFIIKARQRYNDWSIVLTWIL